MFINRQSKISSIIKANPDSIDAIASLSKPQWLQHTSSSDIIRFDVREMLAGQVLCVINSFIPAPLVSLLEKDKVEHFTEKAGVDEYHTFFLKSAPVRAFSASPPDRIIKDDAETFARLCKRFPVERMQEIDVRALEMPLPMEAILRALGLLPGDGALYVLHKRIPVYLLDELAGRGFEVHIYVLEKALVHLLIFKKAT
jgi:uncharacterized protein (DUF2249 family)